MCFSFSRRNSYTSFSHRYLFLLFLLRETLSTSRVLSRPVNLFRLFLYISRHRIKQMSAKQRAYCKTWKWNTTQIKPTEYISRQNKRIRFVILQLLCNKAITFNKGIPYMMLAKANEQMIQLKPMNMNINSSNKIRIQCVQWFETIIFIEESTYIASISHVPSAASKLARWNITISFADPILPTTPTIANVNEIYSEFYTDYERSHCFIWFIYVNLTRSLCGNFVLVVVTLSLASLFVTWSHNFEQITDTTNDLLFSASTIHRYWLELSDEPRMPQSHAISLRKISTFSMLSIHNVWEFFSVFQGQVFHAFCCCCCYRWIFVLFTFSLLYFSYFIGFFAAYYRFCCLLSLLCW